MKKSTLDSVIASLVRAGRTELAKEVAACFQPVKTAKVKKIAAYTLQLTDKEIETLKFVIGRGYCQSLQSVLDLDDGELPKSGTDTVFQIPEHVAWEIKRESESGGEAGHDFGPIPDSLKAKLFDLVEKIV